MEAAVAHMAELFADAPLNPGGWDIAVAALAEFTGAGRAHMAGFGGDNALPFSRFVGMDELPVDDQIKVGAADPRRSWRLGASGGVLEIVGEEQYAALRARPESDSYNEICEVADIPYGAQAILWSEGGAKVGIATFRGRLEGPASRAQLARFALAAPHARVAVRMQRAIEFQGVALTLGAIEALQGAAFLLDRGARVVQMSPAAEKAVRDGWLRIVDRRLAARASTDNAHLRFAIERALLGSKPIPERIWLAPRESDTERAWFEVYMLPTRDWATLFCPRVLVVLHRTAPIDPEHVATLRTLFGLTPGEADIAIRLANGMPRGAIAHARGSTPGTIAIQLKHVLHKLGAGREGELVALVNKLLRG